MQDLTQSQLPVAVIGAGPVGLAAAAHLMARGFTPLIFEAGTVVAANLDSYRHVRLFSPWRYNIDKAARSLLEHHGWQAPVLDELPTAGDIIDHYLTPLANAPEIAAGLHLNTRVTQITRAGFDKVKTVGRENAAFVLRVQQSDGEKEFRAQAVIDASGTWNQPNPLGANGLPALGEAAAADKIAYGMPDILGRFRSRYTGKRVLVVGAGHSAAGTLIALAQLAEEDPGTRLVWAIRGNNLAKIFGGGEADGLPARGALGQRLRALKENGQLELHENFRVFTVTRIGSNLSVMSETSNGVSTVIDGIDEIIGSTGSRPNRAVASELRLKLDAWLESTEQLAPLIDPNLHSCGTVRPHGHRELAHPESRYYAVGAKSYGRAPNFLLATGYEQVRSIAAALAGDMTAADDVQLELPQTGVCNANFPPASASKTSAAAGCCGGPAPQDADACCVKDADAKAEGKSGCGCGDTVAPKVMEKPVKAASCCGSAKQTVSTADAASVALVEPV